MDTNIALKTITPMTMQIHRTVMCSPWLITDCDVTPRVMLISLPVKPGAASSSQVAAITAAVTAATTMNVFGFFIGTSSLKTGRHR
jgi:hypothetical protein